MSIAEEEARMSIAEQEARFTQLVMAMVEETATPVELSEFRALLCGHPEFTLQYLEQMRIHALMSYRATMRGGETFAGNTVPLDGGTASVPFGQRIQSPPASLGGRYSGAPLSGHLKTRAQIKVKHGRWAVSGRDGSPNRPSARNNCTLNKNALITGWKAAAAAALLVVGTGIWYGVPRASNPVSRLPNPASPVTVLDWASGLELPQELPGRIRLSSGTAKVRLPSGVELSLLGSLSLTVESGMEARLTEGRLLAWVPLRASGFTVRAPGLTVRDIGTVFSVATLGDVSDVFVFKGSVQVTDEAGDGIALCEVGEGARARAGVPAVKVAADWPQARTLFLPVRGQAAVAEPQKALDAARQIGEL